jgi:peptidyl-prolyl cis-trans isomerase C
MPAADPNVTAAPTPSSARRWLLAIAHEPFFQFVALGLLLWGIVQFWSGHRSDHMIVIGRAERERIEANYVQQFGQAPTTGQLQALIDRYVREEVYFREGLAQHLGDSDEIIRRRITQKYEFLQTDLALPDAPSADALRLWFERNNRRYLTPESIAFTQVYFSTDRLGEAASRDRALKTLERLRGMAASRAPALGDAFPGPADASHLTRLEAVRVFGRSELSENLFSLPLAQWTGPFRSGYGWHLIYVHGRSPPVLPKLADIRELVLADLEEEQRRVLKARAVDKVLARYTIRYETSPR